MSRDADRDAALLELLLDASSLDEPPLELLVRYVEQPGSLTPEERESVERHAAESPTFAEELRALSDFDRAAALAPAPPGLLARARARIGDWLDSLTPMPLAVGAVAAALLLLAIFPLLRGRSPEAPPTSVVAQRPAEPAPRPGPPARPAPEAQLPPSTATPARSAPTAPETRPESRQPDPTETVPSRPAPVMVAMLEPHYRPPAGAAFRPRAGGVLRGEAADLALSALAPGHEALSASATPRLLWHLAQDPPATGTFELIVQAPDAADPLLVAPLEPSGAGVQRIELSALGASLEPGVTYAWTIAHRIDPANPSRDPFARGWIRFEPPAPELRARLAAAEPGAQPATWASAGYWYDALAGVHAALEDDPRNASARAAWDALLRTAELAIP